MSKSKSTKGPAKSIRRKATAQEIAKLNALVHKKGLGCWPADEWYLENDTFGYFHYSETKKRQAFHPKIHKKLIA